MHPTLHPANTPLADSPLNHRPGMSIETHAATKIRDESTNDSDRFAMGVVFALAVALQTVIALLGPLSNPSLAIHPDSGAYEKLGIATLQNRAFGWASPPTEAIDADVYRVLQAVEQTGRHPELTVETLRTPGYAVLLGLQSVSGSPAWILLAVQIVLGSAAAALAFFAARQLIPHARAGAWVAGLCVALHPAAVASTSAFLPVSICVFLVSAAVALAVQQTVKRSDTPIMGGVCLGLASMMMPLNAIALALVALLPFAQKPSLQSLRKTTVFALCAAAIPMMWAYRNHQQGAGFTLSNLAAVHAYYAPTTTAKHTVNDSTFAAPNAQQQAQTSEWFQATQGRESENVFAVMREQTWKRYEQLGLSGWLREISQRVFFGMTAENTAQAARQMGMSSEAQTQRRDLLSLSHRNPATDTGIHHLGTAWIVINGMLMMLSFIGGIFLVIRGQWLVAMALGGLMFTVVLGRFAGSADPYHMLLLATQPLLIASALSAPIRAEPRRKRRKKRQLEPTQPEFNVYGQPTKHYQDKPKSNQTPAPAPDQASTKGVAEEQTPAPTAKTAFGVSPQEPAPKPDPEPEPEPANPAPAEQTQTFAAKSTPGFTAPASGSGRPI